MKGNVLIISALVVSVIIGSVFFFPYRSYLYQETLADADLTEFPATSGLVNSFLGSWRDKRWEEFSVSNPNGIFSYLANSDIEKLKKHELLSWRILSVDIINEYNNEFVDFEVMLSLKGFDSYATMGLYYYEIDPISEWMIYEHDIDLKPFDYAYYQEYFYDSVRWSAILASAAASCVAAIVLLFSMLVFQKIRSKA